MIDELTGEERDLTDREKLLIDSYIKAAFRWKENPNAATKRHLTVAGMTIRDKRLHEEIIIQGGKRGMEAIHLLWEANGKELGLPHPLEPLLKAHTKQQNKNE